MIINNAQIVEEGIFVFGSNEIGRHRSGAAKTAIQEYGAILGKSFGLQGQSFAIPTKDALIQPLPLEIIRFYVHHFLVFAENNKQLEFMVTKIGCGLAGYQDKDIAPMFEFAPYNCWFDESWKQYIHMPPPLRGMPHRYWGTYDE